MVALSESVMKIRQKRTLAKKSRWRHIRLARKPRYLGNNAYQIKSYCGTLSGSHVCSFRIRHEKSPEVPPSEEITMTSYTAAIKLRYLASHASQIKIYYVILSGSHGRSFRICHENSPKAPPGGEITMTSYPPCNKTLLSQNHVSQIKSYYGSLSGSHGRSFKIRHEKSRETPHGDQITMTSYPACKKPRYLENYASQIKSYNGSLSWSLGRLVIFIKKTANINSKNLTVCKCC